VPVASLVAEYLSQFGNDAQNDQVVRNWLVQTGIPHQVANALLGLLMRLWASGWALGATIAMELAGWDGEAPDGAAVFGQFGTDWASEITATKIAGIAAALAAGGTAQEIQLRVLAVLRKASDAGRIVITELWRAIQAATLKVYAAAGVPMVRWQTEPPDPCPVCLANQAAGPRIFGEPFPSGDIAPLAHPRCRCVLIPVR
jgi:hypothetical protein